MSADSSFDEYVSSNIENIGMDRRLKNLTMEWLCLAINHNYAQNFTWMGLPVIQIPQDIYSVQELIWMVKPDLVIETGIARGGSLVLSASMLALLDYCDALDQDRLLEPKATKRKVLGIDIDIRKHNCEAIMAHPMSHMIQMLQGSSIDQGIIKQVHEVARGYSTVMVFLDSNHTHEHVLAELVAYAPLVSRGSYCVVWDTGVEDLPDGVVIVRPWGKGNNPKTAVLEYLDNIAKQGSFGVDGSSLSFEIDKTIENKIAITASPDGFLRRV